MTEATKYTQTDTLMRAQIFCSSSKMHSQISMHA